jgi:hypothetical protein
VTCTGQGGRSGSRVRLCRELAGGRRDREALPAAAGAKKRGRWPGRERPGHAHLGGDIREDDARRKEEPIAKQGDRVRLLATSDAHVELERGALGTVEFVDSMGTVHVRWDSGVTLGLVADEDSFELVDGEEGDD